MDDESLIKHAEQMFERFKTLDQAMNHHVMDLYAENATIYMGIASGYSTTEAPCESTALFVWVGASTLHDGTCSPMLRLSRDALASRILP